MWLASLIAETVAKERKKKNRKRRLLGHVFCVVVLTVGKEHRSKHFARPMSARITHRFASPPRAGNQNTSLKHWPERNAPRRPHWSWLGPDEPICLSALDRPAGTLPRVREDKVGDPCQTAPACLHFPWQCEAVCVSGRVSLLHSHVKPKILRKGDGTFFLWMADLNAVC